MSFEFDEEKHKKARRHIILGGMAILAAITLLSAVSSFMIYREGFADLPAFFQFALALFAVIVVEGAFIWLVYGFTRVFSSFLERTLSFLGMWALACVMLINIVTHFMMVKHVALTDFQQAWLAWGAVSIFIGVLILVLAISLADPVIRILNLHLRFIGRKEETIIAAKRDGLDTEVVRSAMAERAGYEAEQLAEKIRGELPGPKPGDLQYSPLQDQLDAKRYDHLMEKKRAVWRGGQRIDNALGEEDEPRRFDSH